MTECRPAAIDQLETLCKSINVDFLRLPTDGGPAAMAAEAVKEAKKRGKQALLIDTAGRLQADEDMMQELKDIKARTKPSDTLLVVDAMTGQEAAQV
jgi:signal recognition particle subunit SRP54